jgi:hypothetical protein
MNERQWPIGHMRHDPLCDFRTRATHAIDEQLDSGVSDTEGRLARVINESFPT